MTDASINLEFEVEERDGIYIKYDIDSQIELAAISLDDPLLYYIQAYTQEREPQQASIEDPGEDDQTESAEEIVTDEGDYSPVLDENGNPVVLPGQEITGLYDDDGNPIYTIPVAIDGLAVVVVVLAGPEAAGDLPGSQHARILMLHGFFKGSRRGLQHCGDCQLAVVNDVRVPLGLGHQRGGRSGGGSWGRVGCEHGALHLFGHGHLLHLSFLFFL